MRRRTFLQFLGLGMASATLSPGQLIAEVARPRNIMVGGLPIYPAEWNLKAIVTPIPFTHMDSVVIMSHLAETFIRCETYVPTDGMALL